MDNISRLNPIREILTADPARIRKLFVLDGSSKPKLLEIVEMASTAKIPVVPVSRRWLERMDPHHQGVLAYVSPPGYVSLPGLLAKSDIPFLVLLDGIEDPQNLGAIIRSAEGAGVDGIILPQNRASGLTGTVRKVSAGAVDHMKVARVPNLVRTMEELRRQGVWLVGAEGGGDRQWWDFDYSLPVGLVLGSEGKGLRPLVKRHCDALLSLPLLGRITSLNVAAAAAVFFYEIVRQRGKRTG